MCRIGVYKVCIYVNVAPLSYLVCVYVYNNDRGDINIYTAFILKNPSSEVQYVKTILKQSNRKRGQATIIV